MALLVHGTYSIANVKFRNVVVLPDDNHDSDIVGRPEESSLRGKWVVSCLENGRYTIKNQAIPHFASSVYGAEEGDSVYGGKRAKQLVIKETKFKGRYTISPADADLFWGLPDSETNTPISLANVAADPKNQWMFTLIVDMLQRVPDSAQTGQVITAYETPPMLQATLSSNASQHASIGTDSSVPRPASDAHVYIRNLILKGYGCPLYLPEPSGNSAVYRTKGVRIGDVGFVTDDGFFTTLFNVRASIYDPINLRGVPDGFEQIDLHKDDISVLPDYFEAGRIVASVTATSLDTSSAAIPSAVSSGHRLIWNTSEGAVLHLPHGSTRLTCDPELFRDQAIRNGYNWYKYAWQTRRCGVRNGALCLVTGTDKTDTWMVGAFSQTPPGNQVLLCIGTDVAVHEDCSYSWVGTNPAMRRSKRRPVMSDTAADLADVEQDDAVFGSDAPGGLTHAVFVRGFKISLRQSLWAYLSRNQLTAELSLMQDSAPEDFTGGQDRGQPSGAFSSVFSTWGRGRSNPGGEGQPRTFNSASSPQPNNEEVTVEYVPAALPVDPAMVVNDLLLNLNPEARVAVVHDDEWHRLMQEDDADFPDSSELVTRLNFKYMLDIRNGSVSLLPIEGSLRQSSSEGLAPFSPRLLKSDQGRPKKVIYDSYLDQDISLMSTSPSSCRDEAMELSIDPLNFIDPLSCDEVEPLDFNLTDPLDFNLIEPPDFNLTGDYHDSSDFTTSHTYPSFGSSDPNSHGFGLTLDPLMFDSNLAGNYQNPSTIIQSSGSSSPSSPGFDLIPNQLITASPGVYGVALELFSSPILYGDLSLSSPAADARSVQSTPSPIMGDAGQLPESQLAVQRPLYSYHDQLKMFPDFPRTDPHEHLFIPQQMYKPHIKSDRRRYLEEVRLAEPICFMCENPDEWGISLEDALRSRAQRLRQKEEPMFKDRGPSVSIRLEWPGYGQWSRQIPTKDFKTPPCPITRAKLAKNVAKCVQRFIEEKKRHVMDPDADQRWQVGDKPGQIRFEHLMLVSLHHVAMGNWQPQLRLKA